MVRVRPGTPKKTSLCSGVFFCEQCELIHRRKAMSFFYENCAFFYKYS
jgi:hypothetical protein